MNSDLLTFLLRSQMSKSPGSCTAKRNAPFVSHMDGRQVTQQGLLTNRETGNASEKQDGNPSEKERPDRSGLSSLFSNLLFLSLNVLI